MINWPVLIIVGILAIALLVFIVKKNFKDEKKLEQQLNEDYEKPKDEKRSEDPEKEMK